MRATQPEERKSFVCQSWIECGNMSRPGHSLMLQRVMLNAFKIRSSARRADSIKGA